MAGARAHRHRNDVGVYVQGGEMRVLFAIIAPVIIAMLVGKVV
jgi:hypothetical protein